MSYQQEQEMNFRAVLGLDEKEAPPVQEKPVETKVTESPKRVKKEKNQKQQEDAGKEKKTIQVTRELHQKLKLATIWLDKKGIIESPTIQNVIEDALKYYFENNPDAEKFINKSI